MNMKKMLMVLLCVAVIVTTGIFGTLAYFTDSEAVTNTFTVGRVVITLDEAAVNEQGELLYKETVTEGAAKELADRVMTNDYHLLPGRTYIKDPTVTVDAGSEAAYVRMMATITYQEAADGVLSTQWLNIDNANWIVQGAPVTTKANGKITRTYEFRYKEVVAKSNKETELPALFTQIEVPGSVTSEQMVHLNDMTINVVAHAIQKAGFDNADAAWAAFGQQHAN